MSKRKFYFETEGIWIKAVVKFLIMFGARMNILFIVDCGH